MTIVAPRRVRTTTATTAATAPSMRSAVAPTRVAATPAGGAWHRLLGMLGRVKAAEPHPCMYAGCAAVVGPGEGWRHGWLVFCSDECGAADQEDAVL